MLESRPREISFGTIDSQPSKKSFGSIIKTKNRSVTPLLLENCQKENYEAVNSRPVDSPSVNSLMTSKTNREFLDPVELRGITVLKPTQLQL